MITYTTRGVHLYIVDLLFDVIDGCMVLMYGDVPLLTPDIHMASRCLSILYIDD